MRLQEVSTDVEPYVEVHALPQRAAENFIEDHQLFPFRLQLLYKPMERDLCVCRK